MFGGSYNPIKMAKFGMVYSLDLFLLGHFTAFALYLIGENHCLQMFVEFSMDFPIKSQRFPVISYGFTAWVQYPMADLRKKTRSFSWWGEPTGALRVFELACRVIWRKKALWGRLTRRCWKNYGRYYPLVNKHRPWKSPIFLMETSLPTPTTARVYVNLLEGKILIMNRW